MSLLSPVTENNFTFEKINTLAKKICQGTPTNTYTYLCHRNHLNDHDYELIYLTASIIASAASNFLDFLLLFWSCHFMQLKNPNLVCLLFWSLNGHWPKLLVNNWNKKKITHFDQIDQKNLKSFWVMFVANPKIAPLQLQKWPQKFWTKKFHKCRYLTQNSKRKNKSRTPITAFM